MVVQKVSNRMTLIGQLSTATSHPPGPCRNMVSTARHYRVREQCLYILQSVQIVRSTPLLQVMCLSVAVANVEQPKEEIELNVQLAANFLASLLKKNWQNIKV